MRNTKTPPVIPREKREKCGTCRHAEPEKANGVWYVKCALRGRYYAASGASWCGAYRPSEIEQYVAERGWERNAEEEA